MSLSAVGLTGLLVTLGVYGWRLQDVNGATWRLAGAVEMKRCVNVNAQRGLITDRHDTPLAANTGLEDVYAVPALIRTDTVAQSHLAAALGTSPAQLHQLLAGTPATQLALRVAELPQPAADRVAQSAVRGLFVTPAPRRVYPSGPLLGPALGFVGVSTPADQRRWAGLPPGELVGRTGLEEMYDPILRGVDGQQCVYVNPAGVPVAMAARRDAVPGANVRLSIDLGLQQALTASLGSAMAVAHGDLGGAVVMDPHSGEVLAMASLPSFDNSAYGPPLDSAALSQAQHAPGNPMLEHVTQVVAPPGSTFKLVVASTDMVYRVVRPEQVVPTGATFTLGDHTFNNWKPLGPMNLIDSIAWSNDVYFYKLALALGPDRIYQIGSDLGVGRPTGIDLPGESAGYFGSPTSVRRIGAKWYPASTVILGIGQGYLDVTPLQNARWTAAVATGVLAVPHLGLAYGRAAEPYLSLPQPAASPLPFAAALGPVRAGMRQAVVGGTSSILGNLPVPAAAKSGTAQDPASVGGASDAWLSAVAPFDNPEIEVTSLVRSGGFGAETSGPVVDQAMQYFFAHRAQIVATAPLAARQP